LLINKLTIWLLLLMLIAEPLGRISGSTRPLKLTRPGLSNFRWSASSRCLLRICS